MHKPGVGARGTRPAEQGNPAGTAVLTLGEPMVASTATGADNETSGARGEPKPKTIPCVFAQSNGV